MLRLSPSFKSRRFDTTLPLRNVTAGVAVALEDDSSQVL